MKTKGQIVRKLLQPASCYINPTNDFIINLKRHYDCLNGVHARRGYYKTYLNGKHYYSWEKYKKWILELRIVLENLGYNNVGFVLCSDDKASSKSFK